MEPDEVLALTNVHWMDRRTKLDELMAETTLQLMEIKALLALATLGEKAPEVLELLEAERENWYFSYPQDGSLAILPIGETIINFVTGEIKLPTGTKTQLTDNLHNHNLLFARSLILIHNKTIYIKLDERDTIVLAPSNLTSLRNIKFKILRIKTTSETEAFVMGSSHPEGIPEIEPSDYPKEATTPIIYNVTLTNANTEYSQALPENTKKLAIQCRNGYDIRFAFETGKVATPTEPYGTIKSGGAYNEPDANLIDKTLYLACGAAGQTVEIVVYT